MQVCRWCAVISLDSSVVLHFVRFEVWHGCHSCTKRTKECTALANTGSYIFFVRAHLVPIELRSDSPDRTVAHVAQTRVPDAERVPDRTSVHHLFTTNTGTYIAIFCGCRGIA